MNQVANGGRMEDGEKYRAITLSPSGEVRPVIKVTSTETYQKAYPGDITFLVAFRHNGPQLCFALEGKEKPYSEEADVVTFYSDSKITEDFKRNNPEITDWLYSENENFILPSGYGWDGINITTINN